ncbi:MAG: hypothetical protein OEY64_03115 [Nitrospinota bacterium]|nr:hypothetical protein [Nitrospinota bacterium]
MTSLERFLLYGMVYLWVLRGMFGFVESDMFIGFVKGYSGKTPVEHAQQFGEKHRPWFKRVFLSNDKGEGR